MEINNVVYKVIHGCPDSKLLKPIIALYKSIFSDADINFFTKRLEGNPDIYLALAYKNNILIGFKIGYPYNKETFYSWIGGVHSKYRNLKIGSVLLNLMEDYAIQLG